MFFCSPDPGVGGPCEEAASWPGDKLVADFDFSLWHKTYPINIDFIDRIVTRGPGSYEMVYNGTNRPRWATWTSGSQWEAAEFYGTVHANPATCYFQATGSLPAAASTNNNTSTTLADSGGMGATNVFFVIQGMAGVDTNWGSHSGIAHGASGQRTTTFSCDSDAFRTNTENPGGVSTTITPTGFRSIPIVLEHGANAASSNNQYVARHGKFAVTSSFGGTSALGTPAFSNASNVYFLLGCRWWAGANQQSQQFVGKIRRVLIFNRFLTSTERKVVAQRLRTQYSCV